MAKAAYLNHKKGFFFSFRFFFLANKTDGKQFSPQISFQNCRGTQTQKTLLPVDSADFLENRGL